MGGIFDFPHHTFIIDTYYHVPFVSYWIQYYFCCGLWCLYIHWLYYGKGGGWQKQRDRCLVKPLTTSTWVDAWTFHTFCHEAYSHIFTGEPYPYLLFSVTISDNKGMVFKSTALNKVVWADEIYCMRTFSQNLRIFRKPWRHYLSLT